MAFLLTWASLAAEVKTGRTQLSADGKFGIRFRELEKGRCQVEVIRGNVPEFALDKCVGTIDDLYFISNDGSHFWVLYTLPRRPRSDRESPQSWEQTVVATLFNRQGRVVQSKRLTDIAPRRELSHVRQLRAHFQWLEGVAGIKGRRPRVNSQDKVELEIIGGKTYTLPF